MRHDGPFRVADSIDAGRTPGELRGKTWDSSVHGVRVASHDITYRDRCEMFATRMPETTFFSHITAARLQGIPVPFAREQSALLDIGSVAPARAPHARGIRGHQLELSDADVVISRGLRHTSPARTWCDLASEMPLLDLVAAGDFIIQWRTPLASRFELAIAAQHFAGHRGVRTIIRALELLDERAESPPESMLRVIIQLGGLPTPRINHTTIDTETGRALRPDFTFDEFRTILEYQGDYHRTKAQWRKDMTRRSRLEAQGWKVMELNWEDLKDPAELCSRILALLHR